MTGMEIVPGFDALDDEWITWDDIAASPGRHDLRQRPRGADPRLVRYFEDLLSLARRYHRDTGRHLHAYGDIGEFFCAITLGMKLHRNYAQGSDGRRGNDFIEVKTIAPFSQNQSVTVKLSGNFSHLFVVRIDDGFRVEGRMIDRRSLPTPKHGRAEVRWSDLPAG